MAFSLVLSSPVFRLAARVSAAAAGSQRHTARRGKVFFCPRRLPFPIIQLCSPSESFAGPFSAVPTFTSFPVVFVKPRSVLEPQDVSQPLAVLQRGGGMGCPRCEMG